MKILIISSLSPYGSANYGKRLIDTFQRAGHTVDYLTKFRFDGMKNNMFSVYDEMEPMVSKISPNSRSSDIYYWRFKLPFLDYLLSKREVKQSVIPLDEDEPEVDAQELCDKITKQYDVVLVTFWQYMLTTKTLKLLYKKLHVPIFLSTVDMYPMTGGCYYFNTCTNYKQECVNCPAARLFKNHNIPHNNYLYKKKIYNSINCIYICNNWMKSYVEKSNIIQSGRIRELTGAANPSFLINDNKLSLRQEFGFKENDFIIFAGAANIRLRRKGFYELAMSINKFARKLKSKENVLVVLAGRNDEDFQRYFNVKVRHVGFLSTNKLAQMYRLADLYVSPSIDDAGPSMVVQSLLSGTPVVAFNIGIAPQAIEHKKTGYIAKLGDVKDFAKGIRFIYDFDHSKRESVSMLCRETSLEQRSPSAYIDSFEKIYNEFKDKNV